MSVANLAQCTAIMAQSGAGKSTIIKRRFAKTKPQRLAIWSPDEDLDNYSKLGCKVVRTIAELAKEMANKKFKVVYWPSMNAKKRQAEFTYFCKLVFAVGNLNCLVEELRFVTSASHSPEAWAMLSTRGRKKGIVLIGTSQRPTMVDKDFLGNCTEIIVGSLKYPQDRKACAMAMQVEQSTLNDLELLNFVRVSDYEGTSNIKLTF